MYNNIDIMAIVLRSLRFDIVVENVRITRIPVLKDDNYKKLSLIWNDINNSDWVQE